jgi:hypothetical protein
LFKTLNKIELFYSNKFPLVSEKVKAVVQWENQSEASSPENWKLGIRVVLNHFKIVKQVTWHAKGDYFTSVMPDGQNRAVLIHQLSKRRSHLPIGRPKGQVQCVLFHPIRPFLFVAVSYSNLSFTLSIWSLKEFRIFIILDTKKR